MIGNMCSKLYQLLRFKIYFYHFNFCLQFYSWLWFSSSFMIFKYHLHQTIYETLSFFKHIWWIVQADATHSHWDERRQCRLSRSWNEVQFNSSNEDKNYIGNCSLKYSAFDHKEIIGRKEHSGTICILKGARFLIVLCFN